MLRYREAGGTQARRAPARAAVSTRPSLFGLMASHLLLGVIDTRGSERRILA